MDQRLPETAGGAPVDWRVDVLSKAGCAIPDVKAYAARTWPHAPGDISDDEWQACLTELLIGAIDELGLSRPAPAPAGEGGELVSWLCEEAVQAANSDAPRSAGMLTWAAQVVGEHADLLEQRQPVPVPDCDRNWDSILSPSGGYEMADDAALRDGAQLVNGEWWAPVFGCDSLESALARIRERLERQAAPVPVAVSERPWEREGWCDAEGGFWAEHISRSDITSWRYATAADIGGWAVRCLPFNALPLPSGEVEA